MKENQPRRIQDSTYYLLAIILIGFFVRLIYVLSVGKDLFFNYLSDAGLYHSWALEIIQTGSSRWARFMGPLYPNLVSIIYRITGISQTNVLIFQAVLDAVTVYLVYLIGRELIKKEAGLIAAGIYALYGPAIFYSGLGMTSTLLALFNALICFLIVRAYKKNDNYLFAAAGFVSGVEALAQANILFFLPFLFFFLLKARRLLAFAVFVAALAIPVAYASIRNSLATKEFVFLSSNVGINFYIGNNETADGTYQRPKGLDLTGDFTGQKIAGFLTGRKLKQSEVSRYWLKQGLGFVLRKPGAALLLFLKKTAYYLSRHEIPQAENYYYAQRFTPLLKYNPFVFGLIGPLALLGIFLVWPNRESRLAAYLLIALALSYVAFFVIGRLRQPAAPLIVVFAGAAVYRLIESLKRREGRRLLKPAIVLGVAALIVSLPTVSMDRRQMKRMTESDASISLMYQKKFVEAETKLAGLIKMDPSFTPAYNNLGNLYLRKGLIEKALPFYEHAVNLDTSEGDYRANLGIAYSLVGRLDDAKRELIRARALLPYYLAINDNIAQVNEVADLLARNPAEANLVMAENVLGLGDFDLAIRFFNKSLSHDPKSLRAINDLAVAYSYQQDYDRAIKTLQAGLKLYPDNTDLLHNTASMFYQKKDFPKALEYWNRILQIAPENQEVRDLIREVERGK